ncbi:MAG: signal peptide peptidase SppA [Sphingomonadaceae bacterium]|nr:signal peptide peptidase SppA [Sphingomonadaceae bacterium]
MMQLLRGAWKILVAIKDGLVLLFMLLFFALLYMALTISPNPVVPTSGALHLDLDGVIVEQPEEADPLTLLSGGADAVQQHRLRDIVRALETAATDDRITAVALDLDGFLGGGRSAIAEVADAIQLVRDADKPVIAYATGYGDSAYLLASHASEIWVNPMGGALILGPGGNQLYFGDLLDRYGVTANVFRAGQYKSAVEPFTENRMSPEAREASQALADTLFEIWREDVARARPAAELDAIIASPADTIEAANGDLATAARQTNMVDHLGGRAEWAARVAEVSGESAVANNSGFQSIALANWIAANPVSGGSEKIGIVTVAGTIVDGEAPPGTAGGETITQLIEQASDAHDFAALVIRVDSPGGSALASERIRLAILAAAEAEGDIPIVVSMGNLAASGGYWISTTGEHIVAEPATITGSIGVWSLIPSFEGTLAQWGVNSDGVETTPLSGEPDIAGGLSPEVERLFQAGTEDVYRRFLSLVSESRDMTTERVDEIGQGRVWAGATARQLGLVDQFGNLDDAIAAAAERAEIDASDVQRVYIEQQPSGFAEFLRNLSRDDTANTQVSDPWSLLTPDPRAILAQARAEIGLLINGPVMQARCMECPADIVPGRRNIEDSPQLSLFQWIFG